MFVSVVKILLNTCPRLILFYTAVIYSFLHTEWFNHLLVSKNISNSLHCKVSTKNTSSYTMFSFFSKWRKSTTTERIWHQLMMLVNNKCVLHDKISNQLKWLKPATVILFQTKQEKSLIAKCTGPNLVSKAAISDCWKAWKHFSERF